MVSAGTGKLAVITPSLSVRNCKSAISIYKKVLGARHLYSLTMQEGTIVHSELQIGDSVVVVSDEMQAWGNVSLETLGGTPVRLNVLVDDPDETLSRAAAEGGEVLIAASDQFYGYRSGRFRDPFGHCWIVSKMIEALTPAQMQQWMEAF